MSEPAKQPDWFVLMREWVLQNHGDRGVTLPFLVGALGLKENKVLTPDHAQTILNEMITSPVDDYVTEIAWCSSLGAPVLTATLAPSHFNSKVGFRHPLQNSLCVVFGDDLQERWNSCDEIRLLQELVEDAGGANTRSKVFERSKVKEVS